MKIIYEKKIIFQGCRIFLQVVLQSEEDSEHYTLRSLEVAIPILQDLYFGLNIFLHQTKVYPTIIASLDLCQLITVSSIMVKVAHGEESPREILQIQV